MPRVTGERGAQGIPGGEAIARELDRMATEGGVRGVHARVSYLTQSTAGQEAMVSAGINLANRSTRTTVLGWLADDELRPGVGISKANARRVDEAYAARRRHNMVPSIKRRLAANGGAQIEVYPVDQSGVAQKQRRSLNQRRVNVRPTRWERFVDSWDRDDGPGLDDEWEDLISDALGSDWAAYALVSGIGIGA